MADGAYEFPDRGRLIHLSTNEWCSYSDTPQRNTVESNVRFTLVYFTLSQLRIWI